MSIEKMQWKTKSVSGGFWEGNLTSAGIWAVRFFPSGGFYALKVGRGKSFSEAIDAAQFVKEG